MITDVTFIGKISKIEKKNGRTSTGKDYTYTKFKFQTPNKTKDGVKFRTFFMTTFDDINLSNEGYYVLGADVVNKKNKKDDSYSLELVPRFATKIDIVESKENTSGIRREFDDENNIPF